MLRPADDLARQLDVHARGRDLYTGADGETVVLDSAGVDVTIAFRDGRQVTKIATTPADPRCEAIVGVAASTGFRAAVDDAMPERRERHDVLYQLLDDVPVATLVSGYAVGHSGVRLPRVGVHAPQYPDLCAGWRADGTIMVSIGETGYSPIVTGPDAPDLMVPDDPLAFHDMDPLPASGMRRLRRVDVIDGDPIVVDVLFRDSHMAPDGRETIIHEYTVRAELAPETGIISEIDAVPRVLPWVECPAAADSARRLIGHTLDALRQRVRAEFVGASTCTHLNDTLRSLEDVPALLARL